MVNQEEFTNDTLYIYQYIKSQFDNDVEFDYNELLNSIQDYVNKYQSDVDISQQCYSDFNYICAHYLFLLQKYVESHQYIDIALISYNSTHQYVSKQEMYALWIDISGHLNEHNQIRMFLNKYDDWGNMKDKEVFWRVSWWQNKLHIPNNTYTIFQWDKLKCKFNGSQNILTNYSEFMQDMFVLTMLNGKRHGTFFELGSSIFNVNNNTYLLETLFNWKGVAVEYEKNWAEEFNQYRKNKCIYADATKLNYEYILKENFDAKRIDYLQVDLDPASISLDCLKKVINTSTRFSVVTFEHDEYNLTTGEDGTAIKEESRQFMKEHNYVLVCPDVKCKSKSYSSCEDWYIDAELLNDKYVKETIAKLVDDNYDGIVLNFFYNK